MRIQYSGLFWAKFLISFLGYIENQVIEGGAKKFIPEMDTLNIEISLQREIYDLEVIVYQ
jgi:hypothetical protein